MAETLLIFFSIGGVCWQVFEAITTRLFCIPQYINTTGARVCLKELHESKYDPLSIQYMVLSGEKVLSGKTYGNKNTLSAWG